MSLFPQTKTVQTITNTSGSAPTIGNSEIRVTIPRQARGRQSRNRRKVILLICISYFLSDHAQKSSALPAVKRLVYHQAEGRRGCKCRVLFQLDSVFSRLRWSGAVSCLA